MLKIKPLGRFKDIHAHMCILFSSHRTVLVPLPNPANEQVEVKEFLFVQGHTGSVEVYAITNKSKRLDFRSQTRFTQSVSLENVAYHFRSWMKTQGIPVMQNEYSQEYVKYSEGQEENNNAK